MNRILLHLDHEQNRRLLAEWLSPGYEVVLPDTRQALDEPFDLGILDAAALYRLWPRLRARKARERPLFLPFLLVVSRRQKRTLTRPLRECVDELITSPIEKAELGVRLETLLRTRQFSLELEALNAQLRQSLQQLEEDEEAGRRIQFQLLPEAHKRYGEYEFSRQLLTSAYLSGDFVDYFAIDDNHLGFYMADVSGHGLASAFVTVLLKSYIARHLEGYRENRDETILNPAEVLRRLNRDIFDGHLGKYLTMFYGVLSRPDNRLYYSNGGQFPFPILFDGTESAYVGSKGLPVGLFDFAEYQTTTLRMPPVFAMVLISDGILEALPQSNLRNKQAFLLSQMKSTKITVESLIRQLELDPRKTLPDDITLLLIRRED